MRYIGNRSSGKMGLAVADEAYRRGARVVLVATTPPPSAVPYEVVLVESADEMAAATRAQVSDAAVLVMAAAVADYKPERVAEGKLERSGRETLLTSDSERTVDVLAECAVPGLYRVAFAAEAGPHLERARRKRLAKGAELLVFNDISAPGYRHWRRAQRDHHHLRRGERHVPRTTKAACAVALLDEVERGLG